jgi:hypothetical protein
MTMSGPFNTHGGDEKCITYSILVGYSEVRRSLVTPSRRLIFKYFFILRFENVEWIHLSQDSVEWRALVNTVTNV